MGQLAALETPYTLRGFSMCCNIHYLEMQLLFKILQSQILMETWILSLLPLPAPNAGAGLSHSGRINF